MRLTAFFSAMVVLFCAFSALARSEDLGQKRRNEIMLPAVQVHGEKYGSGTVIFSRQYSLVLTAYHVIINTDAPGYKTAPHDGQVYVMKDGHHWRAKVLKLDDTRDLALLSIDEPLPSASLASAKIYPEVADDIYAVGCPEQHCGTITSGLVSQKEPLYGSEYIRFTAPILPGMSGGGLFWLDPWRHVYVLVGVILQLYIPPDGMRSVSSDDPAHPGYYLSFLNLGADTKTILNFLSDPKLNRYK